MPGLARSPSAGLSIANVGYCVHADDESLAAQVPRSRRLQVGGDAAYPVLERLKNVGAPGKPVAEPYWYSEIDTPLDSLQAAGGGVEMRAKGAGNRGSARCDVLTSNVVLDSLRISVEGVMTVVCVLPDWISGVAMQLLSVKRW